MAATARAAAPARRHPSGPAAPARPARRTPEPARRRKPTAARRRSRPRSVPARLAALQRSAFVDRLLTGRAWIVLVAGLLAGIVFANVALLELNAGIAHTTEQVAALKRENARLRLQAARLGSSERIQRAAADIGLVLPAPGEVRYLKARPRRDEALALRRMSAPDPVPVAAPAPVAPPPVPVATAPPPAAAPTTTTAPSPAPTATTTAPAAPTATATTPPATAAPEQTG